jgi:undecaprenyl-diphosphatase
MQIDIFWFRVINNLAGLNNILDILAIFFATFLLPLLFVLLIPVSFFLKKLPEEKWWELPLKIFASMTLAYVLRIILGKIFFRLRPFVELANVHQLIFVPPSEPSFPSGHAATSFALAFTIFWVDREWGWGFLLIPLMF